MNTKIDVGSPKPRLALAIATGLGVGYAPVAPGTFGSLLGVGLAWLALLAKPFVAIQIASVILVSVAGVWAAERVSVNLKKKDPQIVVIDEIAGQMITYLGLATIPMIAVSWKYLLGGFVLFRVFDIWKPFPIRRLEALPGGLGIMADDWLAGVYAGVLLALARHLGL